MTYLLDTHAFLWWICADPRFSAKLLEELAASRGPVYLSVASLWEMVIKFKLGKLRLHMDGSFSDYILKQVQVNRLELLPIHSHHVLGLLSLPEHHRDPFDRLLVAQAKAERLMLISRDAAFQAYDVPLYWPS